MLTTHPRRESKCRERWFDHRHAESLPRRAAGRRRRPRRRRQPGRGLLQLHPDVSAAEQRVGFGTSGHRGSSLSAAFNEDHILATSQAICEYRAAQGIDGPLFLGADTPRAVRARGRSPRWRCSPRNGVDGAGRLPATGYTPTPAVSHGDPGPQPRQRRRIRAGRRHRGHALAQPARRRRLQVQPAGRRAGRHRDHRLDPGPGERAARRRPARRSSASPTSGPAPRPRPAVRLPRRLRRRAARRAGPRRRSAPPGVRIGADPLGGASVAYWGEIGDALRPRPDGREPATSTRRCGS